LKILLVEDNLLNQKVVAFYLKRFNFTLVFAENWHEVIEELDKEFPDLILMDIMLPDKDGYEITAEIRELEQNMGRKTGVPIVALTANTLDNDEKKCLDAGMNGYLSKPFSPEELHDVILQFAKNKQHE
jgi:CheY-like chemotaxis protein